MALCTVIDHAVKPQTRDFTAQMPPELHVQMKRWVAAEPFFILCCENVWTRRGALPLVDAFTVKKKQQKQLWLFFSTQVGLRWPRSPLTADVPDQFKRLSAQRGGLLTVSFLFFCISQGDWTRFGLCCVKLHASCSLVLRHKQAAKVEAGPRWDTDN